MSKLLSVLAFAGDKVSAAAAAQREVCESVARAMLHGDKSYLVDTVRECAGKTRTAVAVRETLAYLADALTVIRSGATPAAATDATPAWSAGFTFAPLPDGATVAECTAKGAKPASVAAALTPWANTVGAAWMAATVAHIDAAAAAAKATREKNAAAKAADATPAAAAAPADSGRLDGAVILDDAIGAAVADALTIAQKNTERARDAAKAAELRAAELSVLLAAMEQRAAVAEQRAAVAEAEAATLRAAVKPAAAKRTAKGAPVSA